MYVYLTIGTEVSQTIGYCLGRERRCDLVSLTEKGAVVVILGCLLRGMTLLVLRCLLRFIFSEGLLLWDDF